MDTKKMNEQELAMVDEQEQLEVKDSVKTAMLKAVRKNPQKFLAMARRKQYYSEENFENVVFNMLTSGLGRKGRRNAARKMMVTWDEYLEIEDMVIENNIDSLSDALVDGWLSSCHQRHSNGKMSKRDLSLSVLIAEQHLTMEQAIDVHDNYENCFAK